MKTNLHHAHLFASDIDKSINFYREMFGAEVLFDLEMAGDFITFIPVFDKISLVAGELKCRYHNLSMLDSVVCAEALIRKSYIYTTETHFNEIKNLKVKTFQF